MTNSIDHHFQDLLEALASSGGRYYNEQQRQLLKTVFFEFADALSANSSSDNVSETGSLEFSVHPGRDGTEGTFDIQCDVSGATIASFPYWDEEEDVRREVTRFANILELLVHDGLLDEQGCIQSYLARRIRNHRVLNTNANRNESEIEF